MGTISFPEIEAIARDESAKLQHFYIGVEHLFIALTRLDGGITPEALQQIGISPRYLRYTLRDLAGRGEERRSWVGYRVTPRATRVLERARGFLTQGIAPAERALLLAILDEGQSIPIRALIESKADIPALRKIIEDWSGEMQVRVPPAVIQGGDTLNTDQQTVLQAMFRNYSEVHIERMFTEGFSGYSGSTVILVRPWHADKRADALVVVKLYERQAILWEKRRYDSFVRDRLPPKTARIEGDPVLPDHLTIGGLKYTFIRSGDEALPMNLGNYAMTVSPVTVAHFLRQKLYDAFKETWWGQRKSYLMTVWQEYDLMLPPVLVVRQIEAEKPPSTARVLRPAGDWMRSGVVRPGETIALEGFTVVKVKHSAHQATGAIQLAVGAESEASNYAGRIDVQDVAFGSKGFYRGETISRVVAQVVRTRDDALQQQIQTLEPDFNVLDDLLPPISDGERPLMPLPNPLRHYGRLLDRRATATLSTIHGDLHTGNVLVGPTGDAWLIDFEWARDGHTLFDWAVLEVSVLIDLVIDPKDKNWETVRKVIARLDRIDQRLPLENEDTLDQRLGIVAEIRHIVGELLATPGDWSEYFIALAMCGMRVLSWENRPLAARRLAFLVAALAIGAAERARRTYTATSSDLTIDQTTDHSHPGGMTMNPV